MNGIIIGIDPGATGGIATLSAEGLSVIPMPWFPGVGVDLAALRGILIAADHVFIEEVQTRGYVGKRRCPVCKRGAGQNPKATLTTGVNWGRIEGAARMLSCSLTVVPVRSWQKAMLDGLGKGDRKARKAASVTVAQRLWPTADFRPTDQCRVPSDGMCEAALIAEFGRRLLCGQNPE